MQQIPWKKIHALEAEIKALKNINKPAQKGQKCALSGYYGVFKGPNLTMKDFKEAKKIWHHSEDHIK